MKILSATQIRALDAHTIKKEPIPSIDLMERAANAFCSKFTQLKGIDRKKPVSIFCGPGNNGGDGLAVGRILSGQGFRVQIVTCEIGSHKSEDYLINLERLPVALKENLIVIQKGDEVSFPETEGLIIDAIFGTGLSRPVSGYWGELIENINSSKAIKIAIDTPSGLFTDRSSLGNIIFQANYTITFELPKLAFMFPENGEYVGEWIAVSIGLDQDFIQSAETDFFYTDKEDILSFLKPRNKFDHKGTYGHALLIVGSYGMAGAAVLSSRAALRSGVGLLDVYIPDKLYDILQISAPEAMVLTEPPPHPKYFSIPPDTQKYQAVGIGCGLGMQEVTVKAFADFLGQQNQPIVIDADALNIIAQNPGLLKAIPPNSILTPHPGEFKRLFGNSENEIKRLALQREKAISYQIFILLKGAHSCLATPAGEAYFNSTGNPGMATGGSGDVLTGIITGLLAQSYSPLQSALLGMYLHGLAGDFAARQRGLSAMTAQDIVEAI